MPGAVEAALHDFRQTDHRLAAALAQDMDGQARSRDNALGRSFNFNPALHLSWRLIDLNADGTPEVFLLFEWPPLHGNRPPWGW